MSISGNIATMPFADLLQWVSQSRKTGTLVLDGDPFGKKIYFKDGLVVAAASGNPKEFLGYYFVGWGFVAEEELQELLDMQEKHGTLLGELLVIIGRMSREDLNRVLLAKTEESIYQLFLWDTGEFRFLEKVLPDKKFQPLAMAVDAIIMEGVRRKDEWERCREVIPDTTWVPKVVKAVDVQNMGEAEHRIFREIDANNSIEKIALNCRTGVFNVLEYVYQGLEAGLFAVQPPAEPESHIPGFSQGMWRVLLNKAEAALVDGDLLGAHSHLTEMLTKYSDKREAVEHATDLDRRITEAVEKSSLEDSSVIELIIPLSELSKIDCSPEEGFLLSRINGAYTLAEIVVMVPGSKLQTSLLVEGLIRRELVRIKS